MEILKLILPYFFIFLTIWLLFLIALSISTMIGMLSKNLSMLFSLIIGIVISYFTTKMLFYLFDFVELKWHHLITYFFIVGAINKGNLDPSTNELTRSHATFILSGLIISVLIQFFIF